MSDNTTINANGVKITEVSPENAELIRQTLAGLGIAPPPGVPGNIAPTAPSAPITVPAPPTPVPVIDHAARQAFAFGPMQKYHRIDRTHPTEVKALVTKLIGVEDVTKLITRPDLWAQFETEIDAIAATPPSAVVPALPAMLTNSKDKYDATFENVARKLRDQTEAQIAFDEFRGCVMIAPAGTIAWRPVTDGDMLRLRETLALNHNFATVAKDTMRDALDLVAADNRFDSQIAWLDSLIWDAVPRIERFLADYCGTIDDEYARAVSLYIWTGLAARSMEPGCQLDMVVVLQSRQGTKKSTSLGAMAPDPDQFTDDVVLHDPTDNFKRLIKGKTVVEIAELAGLNKADINHVKRAITRKTERYVEKYQTKEQSYLRRCMLFGTANEKEFLPDDPTGHRRWLPVEITELDRAKITQCMPQLWAEGLARWRQRRETLGVEHGIAWYDAERLARAHHKGHEITDLWITRISEWLDAPTATGGPPSERPLALSEVLEGAIRMRPDAMTKVHEKRAGNVLRQLGYENRQMKIDGKNRSRWVRQAPPPPLAG